MAQGSVVGEQQKALGVLIQPANGKQPPAAQMFGQQVQNSSLLLILGGGEQSARLMEHDVHKGSAVYPLPIHLDGGLLRVALVLRPSGRLSVHQHPAPGDEFLDLPTGPPSRGGQ